MCQVFLYHPLSLSQTPSNTVLHPHPFFWLQCKEGFRYSQVRGSQYRYRICKHMIFRLHYLQVCDSCMITL